MLGLGEFEEEITETMHDILETGCTILTVGQYLQPGFNHMPVEMYVTPEKFAGTKTLPCLWDLKLWKAIHLFGLLFMQKNTSSRDNICYIAVT